MKSGIKCVVGLKKGKNIFVCEDCKTQIQMTNRRGLFCPKCQTYGGIEEPPTMILCCAECNNPLAVPAIVYFPGGFGSYCLNCDFHPSMQDTFLQRI